MCISGRQFDKQGNLKQWWNNRTIAEFRTAAQCIVDQYSNYTLDEINLSIDGRLTQGENIADNGGLKQAFRVSKSHSKWSFLPVCYIDGAFIMEPQSYQISLRKKSTKLHQNGHKKGLFSEKKRLETLKLHFWRTLFLTYYSSGDC